jgi:hypothetical protein
MASYSRGMARVLLLVAALVPTPARPLSVDPCRETPCLGASRRVPPRPVEVSPVLRLRGAGWLAKAAGMMGAAASAAASLVSPRGHDETSVKGVYKAGRRSRPLGSQLPHRAVLGDEVGTPRADTSKNLTIATPRRTFVQPPWDPPNETSIESMLQSVPGWSTDGRGTFTAEVGWRAGMRVPARFWASKETLRLLIVEYLKNQAREDAGLPWAGGFLPGFIQLAQVAHLPGTVGYSLGMPDIHSGYGFAIGGVAAVDLDNNESVVSPGGVGFDINCGVRLLRTNLQADDVMAVKDELADMLFKMVPVGVGHGR